MQKSNGRPDGSPSTASAASSRGGPCPGPDVGPHSANPVGSHAITDVEFVARKRVLYSRKYLNRLGPEGQRELEKTTDLLNGLARTGQFADEVESNMTTLEQYFKMLAMVVDTDQPSYRDNDDDDFIASDPQKVIEGKLAKISGGVELRLFDSDETTAPIRDALIALIRRLQALLVQRRETIKILTTAYNFVVEKLGPDTRFYIQVLGTKIVESENQLAKLKTQLAEVETQLADRPRATPLNEVGFSMQLVAHHGTDSETAENILVRKTLAHAEKDRDRYEALYNELMFQVNELGGMQKLQVLAAELMDFRSRISDDLLADLFEMPQEPPDPTMAELEKQLVGVRAELDDERRAVWHSKELVEAQQLRDRISDEQLAANLVETPQETPGPTVAELEKQLACVRAELDDERRAVCHSKELVEAQQLRNRISDEQLAANLVETPQEPPGPTVAELEKQLACVRAELDDERRAVRQARKLVAREAPPLTGAVRTFFLLSLTPLHNLRRLILLIFVLVLGLDIAVQPLRLMLPSGLLRRLCLSSHRRLTVAAELKVWCTKLVVAACTVWVLFVYLVAVAERDVWEGANYNWRARYARHMQTGFRPRYLWPWIPDWRFATLPLGDNSGNWFGLMPWEVS